MLVLVTLILKSILYLIQSPKEYYWNKVIIKLFHFSTWNDIKSPWFFIKNWNNKPFGIQVINNFGNVSWNLYFSNFLPTGIFVWSFVNIELKVWFKCLMCSWGDTEPNQAYQYHREEPPQNPNKSEKKMFFFQGIFTWLKPKLKNRWSDASIEASDRRFFQDCYSFTC